MSDLISRQAAIDAIHEEFDECLVWDESGQHTADEVERILYNVPSAEPRPKGRWIDETFKPWGLVHHPYKCNQCGEHSEMDSDFCPNCGADMRQRGEQE